MTYERIILGPRYNLRLEDLQASDAIEVECLNCRRRGLIATHRLHDRFDGVERMVNIAHRMRCQGCGSSGAMMWHVVGARP